jgi:pimeloyl-ACP methyl ester carboxylesterase
MSKAQKQKWFFMRGLVREAGHWSGFLERFEQAFPNREAIPLDLPGNGTHFREPSPLSVPAMMQKVREAFLQQRGEDNYLFALSLGAMVGIQWLHSHPNDLQGAVLVNTSLRGLSPIHHRLRPANYGKILRIMASGDVHFRERSILEMTSRRKECFDRLEKDWAEIQKARPVSVRNALRQLLAATRFRPPQKKPIARILILNGAKDGLVSPSCSQAIARHWQVPLLVHPEAGHDLTLDAPDWVVEQLKLFSAQPGVEEKSREQQEKI